MRLFLFLFLIIPFLGQAQKNYKVAGIGFYNLENLFDTEDDPKIRDEEFTPEGEKAWSQEKYEEKLDNLAEVVALVGTDVTPDGLAIVGVAEIENRKVLEDLAKRPAIAKRDYQVVHFDSPDKRGIDVALLYQPKYFEVTDSKAHTLNIERDGRRVFTRDVLQVSGKLDGEMVHVLVNHWPSRRGGEEASAPLRNAAAQLCLDIINELKKEDKQAKVVIMGDLNDDPSSPSVKKIIQAKKKKKKVKKGGYFNPMYQYYSKGLGTMAYRDAWSLFDQIIVSEPLLDESQNGYFFYKAGIFRKPWLLQTSGQYKGYPKRAFVGSEWKDGYSDHLPVYVYLVKAQ